MHKPYRARSLIAALSLLIVGTIAPQAAHAYTNGHLPERALSPIASGVSCPKPGGELANRAAAGYNTMALAAGHELPIDGCDSAYRSYDRQVYLWNHCPFICAVPGTSNHGLGHAVDIPPTVRAFIDASNGAFGFDKACSDAPTEAWHVVFCRSFTRPNPGPNLRAPRLVRGSGGPGQAGWVKKLQKLLRRHGARRITPDGILGAHTCFALKRFKQANHLSGKCLATEHVWKALHAPIVKPNPKPKPAPQPHHHHRHHHHGRGPPKGPAYGIDVSQAQGSIDWSKVRASGKRFAYVKATEGQDFKDPTFSASRLEAMRRAHVVPGVYHFLRPRSDRPGSREATWFIQTIAAAGYGKGDLPPVMDLETTTLSASATCHYAHSFYGRVRDVLHLHAIIYTYPSFAQTYLAGCRWMAHKRLWIANYGVSQPTVPTPWSSYLIWQFSSTGHVDGIGGNVDLDKLPGGIAALRRLRIDPAKKVTQAPAVKVPATQPGPALPANPAVRPPVLTAGARGE
jgi:GH25 family lysozyme M1 (1,4-beta-N-acetylmuramidase)